MLKDIAAALFIAVSTFTPLSVQAQARPFLDIVILFDHSYSMFEHDDGRLQEAKSATIDFIDHLNPKYDRAALVRFSEKAEVQKMLGASFLDIKDKIRSYRIDSFSAFTDMQNAIKKGREEIISARARKDSKKIIILLSDGGINRPKFNGREDAAYAHSLAFDEGRVTGNGGIVIHTVIIGTDPGDQQILKEIAAITGGKSYFAVAPLDLIPVYEEIAGKIADEPVIKSLSDPALYSKDSAVETGGLQKTVIAPDGTEFVVPPASIMRGEMSDEGFSKNLIATSSAAYPVVIVSVLILSLFGLGGVAGFFLASKKFL